MKRTPEQYRIPEQIPDGEYGVYNQRVSGKELGMFIWAAIANSSKERIFVRPDVEIEFHISVKNGIIDRDHTNAKIKQVDPNGFNMGNFIPSDELCRLLVDYCRSHEGKEFP